MKAEPQREHRWLEQLVGDWTVTSDMPMEAGQEPSSIAWSESVRSLHGIWFVAEGHGNMPDGGAAATQMTLGYDPQRQRYVGTWIGSMMTYLWVYEGTLDETGTVLTLDATGPDFAKGGEHVKYQDIITLKGDDRRELSSRMLTEDGTWKTIMTVQYQRQR